MPKIPSITATLKDAQGVRTVWAAAPDFKMGSIAFEDFNAALDSACGLDKEYAAKDVELTGVKGKRDDSVRHLSVLVTRFRSGIRSAFGPDSVQYEQAGGTRSSARKAPARKAMTAASPAVTPQA